MSRVTGEEGRALQASSPALAKGHLGRRGPVQGVGNHGRKQWDGQGGASVQCGEVDCTV